MMSLPHQLETYLQESCRRVLVGGKAILACSAAGAGGGAPPGPQPRASLAILDNKNTVSEVSRLQKNFLRLIDAARTCAGSRRELLQHPLHLCQCFRIIQKVAQEPTVPA